MSAKTTLGVSILLIAFALLLVQLDLIDADWLRIVVPIILLLTGAGMVFRRRPRPPEGPNK